MRVGGVTFFLDFRIWFWICSRRAYSRSSSRRPKAVRQRLTFCGRQGREVNSGQPALRLNPPNALSEEKSLDPVDVAGALADETLTLAVRTARILLLDRRHTDDRTDVTLASVDGDERAQQRQDVDPVGLNPTRPAIDLDAGRVEDTAFDILRCERPGNQNPS